MTLGIGDRRALADRIAQALFADPFVIGPAEMVDQGIEESPEWRKEITDEIFRQINVFFGVEE